MSKVDKPVTSSTEAILATVKETSPLKSSSSNSPGHTSRPSLSKLVGGFSKSFRRNEIFSSSEGEDQNSQRSRTSSFDLPSLKVSPSTSHDQVHNRQRSITLPTLPSPSLMLKSKFSFPSTKTKSPEKYQEEANEKDKENVQGINLQISTTSKDDTSTSKGSPKEEKHTATSPGGTTRRYISGFSNRLREGVTQVGTSVNNLNIDYSEFAAGLKRNVDDSLKTAELKSHELKTELKRKTNTFNNDLNDSIEALRTPDMDDRMENRVKEWKFLMKDWSTHHRSERVQRFIFTI